MPARPVQLQVGGQTYKVVSSASADELERLAAVVDDKLTALVPPGRPVTPQMMLLVALALAHEVEQEKKRSARVQGRSRQALQSLLGDVDATLSLANAALLEADGAPPRP